MRPSGSEKNKESMEFHNAFRVFRSYNYRLFFTGQLISRIGMWMQRTAVIWIIYTMTDSVLMVGLATFAEQFPSFLLSPAGGITADRYNRYRVLMVTQVTSALQAVALTVTYHLGYHSLELLLSLSLVLGIANAFDIPARQAMVNEIVEDKKDLPSAIAMNSSVNNLTRLLGPALAGIVLAKYGATLCFLTNALSFIAVIVCLTLMKYSHRPPDRVKKNVWAEFREGWQYTKRQTEIRQTLLLAASVSLLVSTYNTLQPYFAKNIFSGDASTYGYITAATGMGALVSTLYIASQQSNRLLKKILLNNLFILGAGLILMSFVRIEGLYLVMSFICGFGTMSVVPICNTIVQTTSNPQVRGRVLGFFAMATLGTLPLGSLFVGWVAEFISAEHVQLIQGMICLIIAGWFARFLRKPPPLPDIPP